MLGRNFGLESVAVIAGHEGADPGFRNGREEALRRVCDGPFGIVLDQVGIDGDGRCGPSAGRGDHLGTGVGHVPGCPDAGTLVNPVPAM